MRPELQQLLRAHGWRGNVEAAGPADLRVDARVSLGQVRPDLDRAVATVNAILARLKYE